MSKPDDWTEAVDLPQVTDIEPMPEGVEPIEVDEPLPVPAPDAEPEGEPEADQ